MLKPIDEDQFRKIVKDHGKMSAYNPSIEERIDEIYTDAKLYNQMPSKLEAMAMAQEDPSRKFHRYTFVSKDVANDP